MMMQRQHECGSDDLRRLDVELIVAGALTPAAARAMRAFRQAGVFCEVMRVAQTGETGIVYRERWLSPAEFCALVDDQYPKAAAAQTMEAALSPQLAQQVDDVLAGLPPLPPLDATPTLPIASVAPGTPAGYALPGWLPAIQPTQQRQWLPPALPPALPPEQRTAPHYVPGNVPGNVPHPPPLAESQVSAVAAAAVVTPTRPPTTPPTLRAQVRQVWGELRDAWARPQEVSVVRWALETLCACVLLLAVFVASLVMEIHAALR